MNSHTISFEKLRGRENYNAWKRNVKSYLVIKDLWSCTYEELTATSSAVEKSRDLKCLSEIILLIDSHVFSYIDGKETAKDAWDALEKSLSETGLSRRVALLKQFTHTVLSDFGSMEQYVTEMLSLSSRVKSAGLALNDEVIASIMLAGLPAEFNTFVMTIENTQKTLTIEYVKTTLLQESRLDPKRSTSNDSAMFAKNKKFACHFCKQIGHFAKVCPKKKNKPVNNKPRRDSVLFASLLACNVNSKDWYVDSGATSHMSMESSLFSNKRSVLEKNVIVANNSSLKAECIGDLDMFLNVGKEERQSKATITNVTCVPQLCANLLSVSQMAIKGNKIVFEKTSCEIYNANSELIGTASLVNGLYRLNCIPVRNVDSRHKAMIASDNHELWHRRLGHICDSNLIKVQKSSQGLKLSSNKGEQCIVCMKGKQSRLPFKYPGKRARQRLDLIHSDVCGPFEERSHSGARFFVTFVDDFSRNVTVVPIAAKSDVFDEFKKYKSLVENQCSRKIKAFRTDNGTEYSSREFQKFLTEHGIKHEKTAPYTPEQGGVAERINRSIVERIRCMLIDARLCKQFWAEASVTAAYLLNRIPCRGNDETPEEMWTNVKPDLSYLRVFGCRAMVHVPKQKRLKLDEKSTECVLMGYSNESKAYRLYNKTTKKIVISRDVVFFEDKIEINETNINEMKNLLPSTVLQSKCKVDIGSEDANSRGEIVVEIGDQLTSESEHADTLSDGHAPEASTEEAATNQSPSLPEVSSLDSSGVYADDLHDSCYTPDEDTSTLERIRFSIRQQGRNKPNYLPPKYSFMASEEQKCDPLSYNEAMFSAEARHWEEAMKNELDALKACGTWELVNLPSGKRVIGSKWVFKVKRDADGNVCKYKARVVAKGYTQIEGIDYKETYAPVVRYTSIRILIAMAAKLNLRIRQMDAVTAFLNGKLEEDVYMKQPEGCDDGTKRVCKLKRSLYGLKQSSRVWNERLNESLLHFGLVRSEIDQCVYFFPSEKKTLIVAIYVDDVLILSNDSVMEDKLKSNLCHNFRMKDLGDASSILGIRITRNNDHSTISLDQKHYLLDVLKRFNMLDCNPISTPLDPNQKLTKSQCPTETADIEEMSQKPYMQAVGSLLFAAQLTRPDIAYAVNMLSRFGTNPGKAHWAAVKRVLRYVKGTIDKRLTYQKEHSEVEGYCDADHAGNLDTAQTTTGYVFLLQGGAVSWASKLQKRITLSTTESEFVAMVAASKEATWLKGLQREIFPATPKLTILYCDNKGAENKANNNSYSDATKHVLIKLKYLHQRIKNKELKLVHVSSNEMIADALTKGLPKIKLEYFSKKFGLN